MLCVCGTKHDSQHGSKHGSKHDSKHRSKHGSKHSSKHGSKLVSKHGSKKSSRHFRIVIYIKQRNIVNKNNFITCSMDHIEYFKLKNTYKYIDNTACLPSLSARIVNSSEIPAL